MALRAPARKAPAKKAAAKKAPVKKVSKVTITDNGTKVVRSDVEQMKARIAKASIQVGRRNGTRESSARAFTTRATGVPASGIDALLAPERRRVTITIEADVTWDAIINPDNRARNALRNFFSDSELRSATIVAEDIPTPVKAVAKKAAAAAKRS